MSDQSKQEFQEHYIRYMEKQTGLILPDMEPNYDNPTVAALLDFWQASRAALCVELPESKRNHSTGFNEAMHRSREAIQKTGVRVK